MINRLKEKLDSHVVIFDGAIGTEIYKRHFFVNTSFDGLCLTAPDVIAEIHGSYFEAGAEVMTTNSYGANFNKLSKFGLGDQVEEINTAAVQLAKDNCDEDTLIAGSVGPIGEIRYGSGMNDAKIIEILADQIEYLENAGADFIIFETIPSVKDAEYAYQAINQHAKIPYMLSFAVDRNAESAKGESFESLLHNSLQSSGRKPTAIGLNCGEGTEAILSALERILPIVGDFAVVVQPNAGIPKNIEGRMMYMSSPEYFTTYAMRYVNLGVHGIGGCCGTGPDHIRELAQSIRPLTKSHSVIQSVSDDSKDKPLEPVPMKDKSKFAEKLAASEWVTSVEIVPPRGFDLQSTIQKSKHCRESGVDAINIPDGPRASSRISPIITALNIQQYAEIEAILHFCCRDKNLIGMQADLLGCASVGINNILFITGDPPKLGDYPFASGVFDVDSIGMVKIQQQLNCGIDLGGQSIHSQTKTLIGVGADPSAIDMKRELKRTREKAEAGAEFIITQPVFSVNPLMSFIDSISDLKIPVIAGIWPLASCRNAEFMKNEVPGVIVPDTIMERMAKWDKKEDQKNEGIAIAREIIEKIRKRIQGIQVSAPFGNVNTAISVIND